MIITSEELFNKLSDNNSFVIEMEINRIREYSPNQRFPKPKYELFSVLNEWYRLVKAGLIYVNDAGVACKIGNYESKREQVERILPF